MNAIRATQALNKRELEHAIPPSASWHADYRDTAWIYIGGLPLDLSEGDVITIFSQFGCPSHLNLIRDRETGKSKGFGFLKYDDQRSCDLAVDNLGGAEVLGRMLRVDHTRYKKKEDEDEETYRIDRLEAEAVGEVNANGKRASDTDDSGDEEKRRKRQRPQLKEERELQQLLVTQDSDEEDDMRGYLVRQKKEEAEKAKAQERRHRHHHRHRDERRDEDRGRRHKHRHRSPASSGTEDDRRRSHRSYDRDDYQDARQRRPREINSDGNDGHVRRLSRSPGDQPRHRHHRNSRNDKGESNTRPSNHDRNRDDYTGDRRIRSGRDDTRREHRSHPQRSDTD